ncbi:hypothetical protein H3C70_01810 [Patescibacteria group bacterium]|nr:hypothetical protein [Patescibacteria group bacterium]
MKNLLIKLLHHNTRILQILLFFDLVILALHLTFGSTTPFFHLDFEQNLSTFYQSSKLIGFGMIFFLLGLSRQVKLEMKSFILPLALGLIFLGVDEWFQIHENIYRVFELFEWLRPSKVVEASMSMGYHSSLWILYYIPLFLIFAVWSGYWLRYFQSKLKTNVWVIIFSGLCFLTVLLMEILSSTGSYSGATYYWLVTVEELAEMLLASMLVFIGSKILSK